MSSAGGKHRDEQAKAAKIAKMASSWQEHRTRVRNRFKENEFRLDTFKDYEVLELLLFYSIPRADTKQQAKLLKEKFGSIPSVLDADYEILQKIEGIGPQSAMFIKFITALFERYAADYASSRDSITSPKEAKEYMRGKCLNGQRERMYMVCMGNNGKILYSDRIADGEPDGVSVVPADIVKIALRANAVRVVLAHNHPLGICNPSSQDLRMTSIISDELRRVGVELFDHVIIATDGEYSMREKGMLP